MGKRVIETWAQNKLSSAFVWGTNDCNWILCEFVELVGLWTAPQELKQHKGTYSNWKGANATVQQLAKTVDEYIVEAGFALVDDLPRQGDVVKIAIKTRAYNLYLPVIYNQTVLAYDLRNHKITQKNLRDITRDFVTYRRA